MREKKNHIYVDGKEQVLLLHSLVELKNSLYSRGDMGYYLRGSQYLDKESEN